MIPNNENLERLNYSERNQISDCLWLRKLIEVGHRGLFRSNGDVGFLAFLNPQDIELYLPLFF